MDTLALNGTVIAVACDSQHRYSKCRQDVVKLLAGLGVEGDVHAGVYARHRYSPVGSRGLKTLDRSI